MIPAREERGQREFGKHDNLGAALVRAFKQAHHAADGDISALVFLNRSKLGSRDCD
ncbi:hypothetical protein D3C72_1982060 [compost metagenome]